MSHFEILQFASSELAKIGQLEEAIRKGYVKPSEIHEEAAKNSTPERKQLLLSITKKAHAACIKELENY